VLESGWHKHIPLHLLVNDKCWASSSNSQLVSNSLAFEDGRIQVKEIALDASGESSMSIGEFHEAYP
jgi:hypothetical protein